MTLQDIEKARESLQSVARQTDLISASRLGCKTPLFLKLENLQDTGSFKLRGAYNKVVNLSEDEQKCGIIAASAGNHAQGVALAAQKMGVDATIVMPLIAPISKVVATREYGVNVVLEGANFDEAYEAAQRIRAEKNLTFIHPFNDPSVIAGQGTIGLEILEQLEDVECVLVPIGGGGLASGIAAAIKQKKPSCRVFGVQTENLPSMKEAFQNGAPIQIPASSTIADGIAVRKSGDLSFSLCKEYLDGILTVSENEIYAAILLLLEKMKVISEGAGATAVAAALFGKLPNPSLKTCCVVSGGNIDVNVLARIIDRGLMETGRKVRLGVIIADKPGALAIMLAQVAELGANLMGVAHDRAKHSVALGSCYVEIELETESPEHIERVMNELREHGYLPSIES